MEWQAMTDPLEHKKKQKYENKEMNVKWNKYKKKWNVGKQIGEIQGNEE